MKMFLGICSKPDVLDGGLPDAIGWQTVSRFITFMVVSLSICLVSTYMILHVTDF